MLIAAGGATPIGLNRLSRPNFKQLYRHIRSMCRLLFDRLGPFLDKAFVPSPNFYSFSLPGDYDPSFQLASCNTNKSPPMSTSTTFASRFTSFIRNLLHIQLLPLLLLSFALLLIPQQPVEGRLPDKNSFYTQNLGQDSTVVKQIGKNTQLILKVKTHMFDVLVENITIKQKLDYQNGKENTVDLFEQNTNLKFTSYLSIGKDTTLRLISNPLCKDCPIDTLVINGDKVTIKNKAGEIIEENLQTLLTVKKEGNIYKIEFGFEKSFYVSEEVYSLINFYLTYGEVYERHLNAVIGEFKNQPLTFLAFKGKMNGNEPIYEQTTVNEYLDVRYINARDFIKNNYGDSYMLDLQGNQIQAYYWAIATAHTFMSNLSYIGLPTQTIIRVGEKYNRLENTIYNYEKAKEHELEDMVYTRFSKNYEYNNRYDTTRFLMGRIGVTYS